MTEADLRTRLRSRLKVRQLATLLAIAESGSLGRAAVTLGVSQPALSKALGELEAALGHALFTRSRRGLVPNSHGTATIEHARRLLQDVDALAATLDAVDRGAGGRLRLGVIPYVSSDWLRGVAARLLDEAPPIALQISEAATDSLLEALRQRRLDGVVGRITPANAGGDVAWRPVFEQVLRVVARARHPLFRRTRVTIAHLADGEWMLPPPASPTRLLLEQVFAQAGLPAPQSRLETYSLPIMESFLVASDRLAAVPGDIAAQLERRGRIRALPFRWPMPPISLAWLAGDEPSPLIRRFEAAAAGDRRP